MLQQFNRRSLRCFTATTVFNRLRLIVAVRNNGARLHQKFFLVPSSLLLCLFLCCTSRSVAQKTPVAHSTQQFSTKDSTKAQKDSAAAYKKHNIFLGLIHLLSKKHPDTASAPLMPSLVTKAEVPYLPYKGKIIRKIDIRRFGFETTFTDTTKGSTYFGTRILNDLHRDTRAWQIRHNLFIQENTPLNVYFLAENERYLRSLNYIQDVRILVKDLPGTDSVDIVVVTKDLFSITGSVSSFTANKIQLKAGEENLFGTGQKLEVTGVWEKNRDPHVATAVRYGINSVGHSFIDATLTYSQINLNLGRNSKNEHAAMLQLNRPLMSAYARFAGGLTLGSNQSSNDYLLPDSFFYKYHYNIVDGWIGYNLGVKKLMADNNMRDRKFASIRFFNNNFTHLPYQIGGNFNQWYNDKTGILTQFTFFRQNFYKTNYIYGFGTTEDIPTGYNVAVTTGWYKQQGLSRFYNGVDANFYRIDGSGNFLQYFARLGGFWNKGRMEDAGVLLGTSFFSRLYVMDNLKLRQYFRLSYTRQFNRIGFDGLKIDNPYGLRYFRGDSITGDRRLSLHTETFVFLNYRAFGFQFSPFGFADLSWLTPENKSMVKTNFYSGIGGGVRTRNENLVFGTMELRFVYFPRQIDGLNQFKVTGTINLRFRYNTSYVQPPDVIQLNTDNSNILF
jgi:hypothetical protein